MNKSFLILLVIVVALGVGLGGAFAGGVAFGKTQQEADTGAASSRLGAGNFGPAAEAGGGFGGRQGGRTTGGTGEAAAGFGGAATLGAGFGGPGGGDGASSGTGGFGRGGLSGEVTRLEGDLLTIETSQGESQQVKITDETGIQKVAEGTRGDLTEGTPVRIVGRPDDEGTTEARMVIINPENAAALFGGGSFRGGRSRSDDSSDSSDSSGSGGSGGP